MYSTYGRLNVHVWARDMAVVRATYLKFDRPIRRSLEPKIRKLRKSIYREMLGYHHEHQALCRKFRL